MSILAGDVVETHCMYNGQRKVLHTGIVVAAAPTKISIDVGSLQCGKVMIVYENPHDVTVIQLRSRLFYQSERT